MAQQVEETAAETVAGNYVEWSDRGRAGVGRYLIGALTMVVVFFAVGAIPSLVLAAALPDSEHSVIQTTVIVVSGFVIPFFAIPVLTQWLHRRPWWSVAMPWRTVRGWDFTAGFLVSAVVGLVSVGLAGMVGMIDLEWVGFDWSVWVPMLVIALVGLAIQTGSEEMLFRGYLTQFVRRLSKHPVVFVSVPALLFAAPHISNAKSLGGGPLVMVPYFVTGLLYGWASLRSGSLYMSWGLHFNNNLFNVLVVGTTDDILKPAAPLLFPGVGLLTTTVIIVGQCALTWAVLAWLTKRRETRLGGGSSARMHRQEAS